MTSLAALTIAAEAEWLGCCLPGRPGFALPSLVRSQPSRLPDIRDRPVAGRAGAVRRPAGVLDHPRNLGASVQNDRRQTGRAPVDDPWRAVAEYVVGTNGLVRLAYTYQYCEDFPDPRVLTTAARMS